MKCGHFWTLPVVVCYVVRLHELGAPKQPKSKASVLTSLATKTALI